MMGMSIFQSVARLETQHVCRKEVEVMTIREEQIIGKVHEFIQDNEISCAEDVSGMDCVDVKCIEFVSELVEVILGY